MANVLIVAYLLIVLALIAVILLQRSEGGALGIGGGGGGGGFMTARGSANLLTRSTAILATLFFATAIGLTVMSQIDRTTSSILDRAATTQDGAAPGSVLDALNALQGGAPASDLPVPTTDPVAPAGADPVTADSVPAPAPAAESTATPDASGDLPVPEAPAETPAPATN
ncbi:preprotein translocase subunit SecG [Devosia sp. A449]